MNRFFVIFLAIAVCFSLSSCSREAVPPFSEAPPSAPPEVESIIEPLEQHSESSSMPESEIVIVPVPEPPEADVVPANPAPVTPAREKNAVSASADVNHASPQSEAPAILKSIAPDKKPDSEKIEKELLRLINELRLDVGAEALGVQEDMLFAARIRSSEALVSFSHTRPDGTPYNTAFDEAKFTYAGKWHGENLSSLRFTAGMFDEKSAALEMFNGLKDSPGHYQNMVGANFVQTGIGVSLSYEDGVVNIASAQLFSSL